MFKKKTKGRGFFGESEKPKNSNYPKGQAVNQGTGETNNNKNHEGVDFASNSKGEHRESGNAELFFMKGVNHCIKGELALGIHFLTKAAEIDSNVVSTHFNLAKAHKEMGNYHEAIKTLETCLKLNPKYVEAKLELANCFGKEKKYDKQKTQIIEALKLEPRHPGARHNLAMVLAREKKYEEALVLLENLFAENLSFTAAGINAAKCFENLALYAKEKVLLEEVIKRDPQNPGVQQKLATCLLRQEYWLSGWLLYETRFKGCPEGRVELYTHPPIPRWESDELNYKYRYCVVAEQGLGDFFQFIRFYPLLKKRVQSASICCHEDLHGILRESEIDRMPLSRNSIDWDCFDYWVPLMSMPLLLSGENEPYLEGKPYLNIEIPRKTEAIKREVLISKPKLIIGLHWQGSASHEDGQQGIGRSFPLETLAGIAMIDGIVFISLQVGQGSEQIEQCSFKDKFISIDKSDHITLEETLRLIRMTDIVITNDSSPAHLAGSMGKEAWVILKKNADWRWGVGGKTTGWYEKTRLYRQSVDGCWDSAVTQVCNDLICRLNCKKVQSKGSRFDT